MNKIDIEAIEKEISNLTSYINEYEHNYLNLFNEINNSSLLWNDDHSTIFYKKIEEELKNNNKLFNSLKENYNIKSFICNNYKVFGNKIYFNFTKANDVLICYKKIIDKFKIYLNYINNMDYSFYNNEELGMLNEIKNNFSSIIKMLEQSENNVRNTFEMINNVENKVKEMIARSNIVNVSSFKKDNLYS